MTRSSPDSVQSEVGKKRRRVGGSSSAISSSIFAQTAAAAVAARERNAVSPPRPAACSEAHRAPACSCQLRFVQVDHDQERLRRKKLKSAQSFQVFTLQTQASEVAVLLRAPHRQSVTTSRSRSRSAVRLFLRSFSSRSSRRSATPRSARINSSSMACASRAGLTDPDGCATDRILESAEDMNQGIRVLVGGHVHQGLSPAGPSRRRHVGKFDRGRNPLLWVEHRRESIEAGVGHFGDADRGLGLAVTGSGRFLGTRHELKQGRSYRSRTKPISAALSMANED